MALFPNATLMTAYGMTEACSSITFDTLTAPGGRCVAPPVHHGSSSSSTGNQPGAPPPQMHGSQSTGSASAGLGVCLGTPAPGVEVRIDAASADAASLLDERQRSHASAGPASPAGEVLTRGPHLMSGYWPPAGRGGAGSSGSSSGSASAFTPDGWLRTGDLGWLDARGRLWLLGRVKDMIKSGGENVMAAEVEAVLCAHPGVAAAAVVGLPHARLGETVRGSVGMNECACQRACRVAM